MNKLLELSDIHLDASWIDESEADMNRACEVALQEKIDAFTISGDFFNKAPMATEHSKWHRMLRIARKLQQTAQVFYVKGTPSHDAPGVYEALEDIGWKEINIGKSHEVGDLLIMGIQEITPAFIMAKYPELSKQDAIAKQYDLVNQIISDYYIPVSTGHDGPVHFMLHGHVSGAKFKSDQKPRTSEFMFSEQLLSTIGADRIQAGHIHFPQDFKEISGGYVGSSHLTWGDTGFIPGFNVVTYSQHEEPTDRPFDDDGFKMVWKTDVKRFDYGKPERQKIVVDDLDIFVDIRGKLREGVDTWIEVKCDRAFADQFDCNESLSQIMRDVKLGQLSKITCDVQHEEHTRIDTETYEKAKTVEELYKLYDPDVTDSILLKVLEAEEATSQDKASAVQHTFELMDVYLKGSKAGHENGVEEIRMDCDEVANGLTLLTGPNGIGKSFTLGFCTPFSVHLPTGIDLKKLFESKDSQIIRRFRMDGNKVITQKIVIDPTLASPTAKWYMDIDGAPCDNVTGNLAPFNDAVIDLFGSQEMFMTCAFRGQKDNPKIPSLEKASESDLRGIFMSLAGIDRGPMKDYAHGKVVDLNRESELNAREIETIGGMIIDESVIEADIYNTECNIDKSKTDKDNHSQSLESLRAKLSSMDRIKSENEIKQKQIDGLNQELKTIESRISELTSERSRLQASADSLESNQKKRNELIVIRNDYTETSQQYFNLQEKHNQAINDYRVKREAIEKQLNEIKENGAKLRETEKDLNMAYGSIGLTITHLKEAKERENQPCEHCGKLSSNSAQKMTEYQNQIIENQKKLEKTDKQIDEVKELINKALSEYRTTEATLPTEPPEPYGLSDLKAKYQNAPDLSKLSTLEAEIKAAETSASEIMKIDTEEREKVAQASNIKSKIEELTVSVVEFNENTYSSVKWSITEAENAIKEADRLITQSESEIKNLRSKLEENAGRKAKIAELEKVNGKITADISEWKAVEAAFAPKGISAMELSMVAPIVSRKANSLLKIYGTRFSVEIVTRDLDSKNNLAERFRIFVHDSKASDVKLLTDLSGGQAVWATTAIREAIADLSSERSGRSFLWSMLDEADGALDHDTVSVFYDLMNKSADGKKKVISVSHSPAAKEVVDNNISITDFFVDYEGDK